MKFDVIQTQRLDLRKLTPEQYGDILLNCSNQEIMEYLNLEEPEVNIEKEKLKRGFSTHNKSFEIFQLIDKEMYKIIDWRGFHTWFNHRRAKIEYTLNYEVFKSKGLMREAIQAVIRYTTICFIQ